MYILNIKGLIVLICYDNVIFIICCSLTCNMQNKIACHYINLTFLYWFVRIIIFIILNTLNMFFLALHYIIHIQIYIYNVEITNDVDRFDISCHFSIFWLESRDHFSDISLDSSSDIEEYCKIGRFQSDTKLTEKIILFVPHHWSHNCLYWWNNY